MSDPYRIDNPIRIGGKRALSLGSDPVPEQSAPEPDESRLIDWRAAMVELGGFTGDEIELFLLTRLADTPRGAIQQILGWTGKRYVTAAFSLDKKFPRRKHELRPILTRQAMHLSRVSLDALDQQVMAAERVRPKLYGGYVSAAIEFELNDELKVAKDRLDQLRKSRESVESSARELRSSLAGAEARATEESELAVIQDRPENAKIVGAPAAIAKQWREAETRASTIAGAARRQVGVVETLEGKIKERKKEFLMEKLRPIALQLQRAQELEQDLANQMMDICHEAGMGVSPLEIFAVRDVDACFMRNQQMILALKAYRYESMWTDVEPGKPRKLYPLPVRA